MSLTEIRSHIEDIEKDTSLFEEKNFDRRADAIDRLEFHMIIQAEARVETRELNLLKHCAEKIKAELEQVDDILFKKLRANIRAGNCTGKTFRDLIKNYFDLDLDEAGEPGYDNVDLFINRLISFDNMPAQTKELEPDMVFYQKTPARLVFELAEKCHFTKDDVFFDLGSGLGQVANMVNVLTGIRARGIEFEPAFCDYARECAAVLHLPDVVFLNADAREADYTNGTVFFLYTPFTGEMLHEVLELLRKESLQRRIRVITYGPCTTQVALQNWLSPNDITDNHIYRLAFFSSF